MTYNAKAFRKGFLKSELGITPKGCNKDEEHQLQVACFTWLQYQHQDLHKVTFAVPNGGKRDAVTGGKLKAEGAKAGVADVIMLMPSASGRYHSLCIEMKTPTGSQSAAQKEFQRNVTEAGSMYVVCRSLDDFKAVVEQYITNI